MGKSDRECGEPPFKVARLEVDETLKTASTSKSGDITMANDTPQEKKWPSWNKTTVTRASGGADLLVNSHYEDYGAFQLIDEVTGDDDEDDDDNGDIDSDESDEHSYDSEVPEEEIDALLEEGLPEEMKGPRKRRRDPNYEEEKGDAQHPHYEEKEKMVLVEKGSNHFEILPEGWVQITHNSGMPVYLHRPSRVCTMSKPYFLGQGSVRKHDIPVSGVPCLQYIRLLQEEISAGEDKTAGIDKTTCNMQASDLKCEASTAQSNNANNLVSSEQISIGTTATTDDIPDASIATSQSSIEPPPPSPPQFSATPPPLPTDPPLPNSPPVPSPPPLPSSPTDSESPPLPTDAPPLPSSPPASDDISNCPVAHGLNSLHEQIRNDSKLYEHTPTTGNPRLMPGSTQNTLTINASLIGYISSNPLKKFHENNCSLRCQSIFSFLLWIELRTSEIMTNQVRSNPNSKQLVCLPYQYENSGSPNSHKKKWLMNPKGKSYVCILHEYVQHALKRQPIYEFKEVENASTPYAATMIINGMHYCTGYGSSKKSAKMEAAKGTLEILLPELGRKIREETNTRTDDDDLSFFDQIRIEDPNVPELCNKTSELTPFSILLNCLQRNFGLSGASIESKLVTQKNQKNEFVMSVGKHTVQVQCKNKKDGKQKASQAILQKL
ncbi:unnamed protein product, partial [Meganyctiphanes norvegica]